MAGLRYLLSIVDASLPRTRGMAAWKPETNETMHMRTIERIILAGETADAHRMRGSPFAWRDAARPTVRL